jgi:hypothetical protein
MNHDHYGYKANKISSNVKGHMYTFIHYPEAENIWDARELLDNQYIYVSARRQAAKSSTIPQ